jgi:hypothetical protein
MSLNKRVAGIAGKVFEIEDIRTGEAPDPCGKKAYKLDILRYHKGEPNNLLPVKPSDISLCKHCQKSETFAEAG